MSTSSSVTLVASQKEPTISTYSPVIDNLQEEQPISKRKVLNVSSLTKATGTSRIPEAQGNSYRQYRRRRAKDDIAELSSGNDDDDNDVAHLSTGDEDDPNDGDSGGDREQIAEYDAINKVWMCHICSKTYTSRRRLIKEHIVLHFKDPVKSSEKERKNILKSSTFYDSDDENKCSSGSNYSPSESLNQDDDDDENDNEYDSDQELSEMRETEEVDNVGDAGMRNKKDGYTGETIDEGGHADAHKKRHSTGIGKSSANGHDNQLGNESENCDHNDKTSGVKVKSTSKNKRGKRRGKCNYCLYCKVKQSHLARHLNLCHKEEKEVIQAFSHPKFSKQRKLALLLIGNKGNKIHNMDVLKAGSGELVTRRQPSKKKQLAHNYLFCEHCNGMYLGKELWHHVKTCEFKKVSASSGSRHIQMQALNQMPIPDTVSSDVCKEVTEMKQDESSTFYDNDNENKCSSGSHCSLSESKNNDDGDGESDNEYDSDQELSEMRETEEVDNVGDAGMRNKEEGYTGETIDEGGHADAHKKRHSTGIGKSSANGHDNQLGNESENCDHNDKTGGVKVKSTSKNKRGRKQDKCNYCLYCKVKQLHLARHLKFCHKEEKEVVQAFSHPKFSKQRKLALLLIGNKGNKIHNMDVLKAGSGELITRRQPPEKRLAHNYLFCVHCNGMYLRKDLWRHVKTCKFNKVPASSGGRRIQMQALNQMPIPDAVSSNFWKVVTEMRQDEVSVVARKDPLILKHGEKLLKKPGKKLLQDGKVIYNPLKVDHIRQRIRECGRLVIEGRKRHLKCMEDFVMASNLTTVLETVRSLAGYDGVAYAFPTVVTKTGHHLMAVSDIVMCDAIIAEDTAKIKEVENFKRQYKLFWHSELPRKQGLYGNVSEEDDSKDPSASTDFDSSTPSCNAKPKRRHDWASKCAKKVKPGTSKGKQNKKTSWSKAENDAIDRHFMEQIKSKRAVTKAEAIKCLNEEPALVNRQWKQIKWHVKNRSVSYNKAAESNSL
ncbi:uncharacterized protein LOC144444393 [Glandiceps talaboti]